jgi:hypothetical protein
LVNEELPVLFTAQMKRGLVFVSEIDGGKRRISLPQSWTDRGPEALQVGSPSKGLLPRGS